MEVYVFDAYRLRNIFDVLKDLLTHCWIKFDSQKPGLEISNVDPEKIIHINCLLCSNTPKNMQSLEPYVFSTYAQTLYKLFRSISQGQDVTITVNRQQNVVTFLTSKNGFAVESKLTSLLVEQINHEVLPAPVICTHKMSTIQLHKILYTMSSVSRIATIKWDQDGILFQAEDTIQTSLSIPVDTCPEKRNREDPKCIKFVIKYLEKFCNRNFGPIIVLMLCDDSRLIAAYDLQNDDLFLTMASLE